MISAFAGATVESIVDTFADWIEWSWSKTHTAVGWMIPQSLLGWGIAAVAAAFILLAIGAWTSLSRPRRTASSGGDM